MSKTWVSQFSQFELHEQILWPIPDLIAVSFYCSSSFLYISHQVPWLDCWLCLICTSHILLFVAQSWPHFLRLYYWISIVAMASFRALAAWQVKEISAYHYYRRQTVMAQEFLDKDGWEVGQSKKERLNNLWIDLHDYYLLIWFVQNCSASCVPCCRKSQRATRSGWKIACLKEMALQCSTGSKQQVPSVPAGSFQRVWRSAGSSPQWVWKDLGAIISVEENMFQY